MNPDDLRAYGQHAWHVAEALKREHWAREVAARGCPVTFEASQALWERMRRLRPDWPSRQSAARTGPPRRAEARDRPRRGCRPLRCPSLSYSPGSSEPSPGLACAGLEV